MFQELGSCEDYQLPSVTQIKLQMVNVGLSLGKLHFIPVFMSGKVVSSFVGML